MRGHAPILRMRLAGRRPAIVFLCDFETQSSKDWQNPGERYGEVWAPDHATVQIDENESIGLLDLRFLNGLRVCVSGRTEQRAKALFEACKKAGATTVAASHAYFVNPHRCQSGWTEIWHKDVQHG